MGLLSSIGRLINAIKSASTYEMQAPLDWTQAAAVQDQWYTVLDTVYNAKLYAVSMDADANETMGLKITIDGHAIEGEVAVVAATHQHAYIVKEPETTVLEFAVHADLPAISHMAEGRTLKIEARQTTDAGGETIHVGVLYGVK